jgi:2-dehydropantoate 2-reductase
MIKIAVIGPGAIGGTVAAWLSQEVRHDVVVCGRTRFDQIEVETPESLLIATPRVYLDPVAVEPVDWVLIATKAYEVAGTAAWLNRLVGPQTRVAVLQNGVEHVERFSPYLDPARILPVVVELPAERTAPGRIRQRKWGSLVVPSTPLGRDFAGLFQSTRIQVSTTDDFRTQAWRKLCLNSAGAVSAILLEPAGVVHFSPIAEVMRGLVRECVTVGRAEGAILDSSMEDTVIQGYRNGPADSVNSMHADRLAGRPMEIDARNGVIVRLGLKHGIETPRNAMAVALLEAMSRQPAARPS